MREFLSVDREANAIRLRRSTFSGAFLLVEGSSDRVFYERFVERETCVVMSISGKPSSKSRIVEILATLEGSNFPGVLAIVDTDFDYLNDALLRHQNLFYTDTHDLETLLLCSPALDKVVAEFGSAEKITSFNRDIRTTLLEAGLWVGYLRWISQIDELNLTFEGIVFSKFIDEKSLRIDELKLIQEVKNKSQAFLTKSEHLQQRLIHHKNDEHDPWQVCCGHDLVAILSLALRKAIGSAKPSDVEPISLERCLRLAYEESYFHKTQIYDSVCEWESRNQPFKAFRLS
jgi:hypothetical protein